MSRNNADRILDDLRAVVEHAEALMRETAGKAGDEATAARARATESLEAARDKLQSLENELLDRSREAVRDTDRYVRDNPWQSIGIATGVGVLIGLLLSRR